MRKLLMAATAATLAVALLTSPAMADTVRMIGAGAASCGTWTADRQQRSTGRHSLSLMDEQWVLGFLSGIAVMGDESVDPLRRMDAEGVWAWVDNYCQAHPIETISSAAIEFFHIHPSDQRPRPASRG
jgi:hypothetical protein